MDIKNLKEMVDFGLEIIQGGIDLAQKKEMSFLQRALAVGSRVPVMVALGVPAFQELEKIPAELEDLSAQESVELVAHVAAKLAIDDANAKVIVVKSLKAAYPIYDLVKACVDAASGKQLEAA